MICRFLRRIQHSLRARARSQQDCISSRSSGDDDDENIDDSLPSDPWTPPQANATASASAIDTDSPSAIQSKSPESYSPPNVVYATKTARSLSLNASQPSPSQIKSMRKDTYLPDEATSD